MYVNYMFLPSAASADAPAWYAVWAAEAVGQGYPAINIAPFGTVRDAISRAALRPLCAVVRAVRDTVGEAVEIGIDPHGRFGAGVAVQVAQAQEGFAPLSLEELVPPEHVAAMRNVRDPIAAPVATGSGSTPGGASVSR